MGDNIMTLYHFTDRSNKNTIIQKGIIACTKYTTLSKIRENVVFCWLKKEDNKLPKENEICFKVTVDENRCLIADMDYISIAMMYHDNINEEGLIRKPKNKEAVKLLVKLYELTAVQPFKYYEGMHFTPEVLVAGHIPNRIY